MKRVLYRSSFKSLAIIISLSIITLLGLRGQAFATTVVVPSDDDLIIGARAIVRGTVTSIGAAVDRRDDFVYSYITLQLDEVLKGAVTGQEIVIKERGGELADRGDIIFGAPAFTLGEEVLLYLDTRPDGSLRVHQMFLGKFSIIRDPNTGHRMVVRSGLGDGVVALPSHSHTNQSGSTTTNRQQLDAYLDMVRLRLAINQAASNEFLDRHYRNVPIFEKPAEYEGELRRGGITPRFVTISPANPRWFEPLSGQPVIFNVNPDNAPSAQINDDIMAAMNAWSTVPGNPLVVQLGGNTGACGPSSSENTIIFNGCDGQWSPSPGCQGVLALGGLSWTGQSIVVGGVTYRRATRGTVSFNPYASCFFGNNCNVREVMTHELGHALGLGHSQFGDATMFATAHLDGRCASIRQDDINGINFLYIGPGGGGGNPLTITTASPLPNASQGVFYAQALAATGGEPPYSWSLLSGSLPAGLNLSANGAISGTPSASGTSNFTVRVTDNQLATAQKAFSITVSTTGVQYDSQFLSQTVPTQVQPGQSFNANIKWLNTGAATWNGSGGFRVGSQNPPGNLTWGGNVVQLPGVTILPGQQLDLLFTAFAPTTPGVYNFRWQLVQDGVPFGQMSDNVQITVQTISSPLIQGPTSLTWTRDSFFGHQFTATGGTTPYTWSISGTLPSGLAFNSANAILSGVPTVAGTFPITVKVTDSASRMDQKTVTITVHAPALQVTTQSLPTVPVGTPVNFQLAATGGTTPYTWSVMSGVLPAGLSLNPDTGIISGVPVMPGGFGFTVQVADAQSSTAQKSLAMTVMPSPLSVENGTSLDARMGEPFNYQPTAIGGNAPYTWSLMSGALPEGLQLHPNTGAITGTPTGSGTFDFSIKVQDQAFANVTGSFHIRVIDPATIPVITKVKYKAGARKLIVIGQRIDREAILIVDGVEVTSGKYKGDRIVVKKFPLQAGEHEVIIVNPDNISSQPKGFNAK